MKKFGKGLLKLMPFMLIFAGVALFAADPLSPDTEKIIKGGIEDTKVAGGGFLYLFNAFVPAALILGGMIWGIGSAWAKKQDTDGAGKIITTGLSNGLYGYIAAGVLWAVIGLFVNGNVMTGPIMTKHYWTGSVKAAAGDDVFTQVNN